MANHPVRTNWRTEGKYHATTTRANAMQPFRQNFSAISPLGQPAGDCAVFSQLDNSLNNVHPKLARMVSAQA